jgi:hypothetical protein
LEEKVSLPVIINPEKQGDKLKDLFMDSDEEKPNDFQKISHLGDNEKKDGIVLKNIRKSHTIKIQEEEEQKSASVIDHELLMDKPVVRKKKKAPSMFQDEEEVKEETNLAIEKKINLTPPQFKIDEKEEKEMENEGSIFQKERFEEEKSIIPLRLSTNNNSKKLERLFDDEEDEDWGIFNKPKKLDSGPQKKRLIFDDEND